MSRLTREGTANPFRETKFSGANADRKIFIFPVQLTTCRTGNLTRLIHTLAICVTIHTKPTKPRELEALIPIERRYTSVIIQILRRERGQGNIHFSCSADHVQDWQPYPVDPYSV